MNNDIYDDMALEEIAKKQFGIRIDIDHVVARSIPVSRTTVATVFLTKKKQLFVYIHGHSRLLLGDVKKIITRMGCVAELFLPPKGHPDYFDEIGREKFRDVFPARENPSASDIVYYRTLAAYNPALVQILEVKNGELFQYDTDSSGGWRPCTKFTYRRIRTS
jgi:hypothetical protein